MDDGPLYSTGLPLTWEAPNEGTWFYSAGLGTWINNATMLPQGPQVRFDQRLTHQQRLTFFAQNTWSFEGFDVDEYPPIFGPFSRNAPLSPAITYPASNLVISMES